MHKINAPHATAGGEFTDGDPAMGIEATELMAGWHNSIQRELIAVLTAAGITPSTANDAQVIAAIQELIAAHAGATIAHGATSAPTPSRSVLRDGFGRGKFAAAASDEDAVILSQLRTALTTAMMPNYAARVDFGTGFAAPTGGMVTVQRNDGYRWTMQVWINGQDVCYQYSYEYGVAVFTALVAPGDVVTFSGASRASFYPIRGI